VWIGEAGVELQNGSTETELAEGSPTEQESKQIAAAKQFEALHETSTQIERIYYYGYVQPTETERYEKDKFHLFDTGLFEAGPEGKGLESNGEARPAYCRLAFVDHSCKPTVITLKLEEPAEAIRASIDANGLRTTVALERIEPGETTWTKVGESSDIGYGIDNPITMSARCEMNTERGISGVKAPVRYSATNADGTTYSATEKYFWCRAG
jgi:hypothetical protein